MKNSKNNLLRSLVALVILPLFFACNTSDKMGSVNFELSHGVAGSVLELDTVKYMNAAGNEFSVEKLHYYLSGFTLQSSDGDYVSSEVFFVDIKDATTQNIKFSEVPAGSYSGVSLIYGVDPALNTTDGLDASIENINMAWPVPMGGGYHHMKLEGFYYDSSDTYAGYAMHLGRVGYEIMYDFPVDYEVTDEGEVNFRLSYDLMEWHQNPANWDFDVDGVSIMGDLDAQFKLSQNGVNILSLSKY